MTYPPKSAYTPRNKDRLLAAHRRRAMWFRIKVVTFAVGIGVLSLMLLYSTTGCSGNPTTAPVPPPADQILFSPDVVPDTNSFFEDLFNGTELSEQWRQIGGNSTNQTVGAGVLAIHKADDGIYAGSWDYIGYDAAFHPPSDFTLSIGLSFDRDVNPYQMFNFLLYNSDGEVSAGIRLWNSPTHWTLAWLGAEGSAQLDSNYAPREIVFKRQGGFMQIIMDGRIFLTMDGYVNIVGIRMEAADFVGNPNSAVGVEIDYITTESPPDEYYAESKR